MGPLEGFVNIDADIFMKYVYEAAYEGGSSGTSLVYWFSHIRFD